MCICYGKSSDYSNDTEGIIRPDFPEMYCHVCCEMICDCLDADPDGQDCQNCGRPGHPCEMCYPCLCPVTLIIDILTYTCRLGSYWCYLHKYNNAKGHCFDCNPRTHLNEGFTYNNTIHRDVINNQPI